MVARDVDEAHHGHRAGRDTNGSSAEEVARVDEVAFERGLHRVGVGDHAHAVEADDGRRDLLHAPVELVLEV